MRIIYELNADKMSQPIFSRDVVLVPNLFKDFEKNELYDKLLTELKDSGIEKQSLFKMWHGNDIIQGTHLIVNDKTDWKDKSPTFQLIMKRIQKFFNMTIEATRLNWYPDSSTYKSFHHDAAYMNPKKAKIQNFTVAISFGDKRECAFQHSDIDKTVISIPIDDGEIYCFSKDTNILWKHGVLQDPVYREKGRISCVFWGKIEHQKVVGPPQIIEPEFVVEKLKTYLE